ncbi:lymphocyte antigen 75-like [Betta splendens]|uniref:Lymphocyte antigen 75-like n=1 Tax=Betta splendens TaxID=158456 RepID=A0A9W2XB57_BETSP|nr:lymphocyte antigen 75-like [Betta splendens]
MCKVFARDQRGFVFVHNSSGVFRVQFSVKMNQLLILLLLSAFTVSVLAEDVTRHYKAVVQEMNWAEARSYCRAKFTELASIQDAASNTAALPVSGKGRFWIGLFNTSWRWSLGNEDASLNYTNWAPLQPEPGSCVTVSDSGLWSVRDCAVQYRSLCYSAATNSQVLVQTLMSWDDAQANCRSQFTDMSSIRTAADNTQASSLLSSPAQPTALSSGTSTLLNRPTSQLSPVEAWFGLSRFLWGWSDSSTFNYSQWGQNQPIWTLNCVALDAASAQWFSQVCEDNLPFICYTDRTYSDLKTVKVRLSGGPADPNDSVLQDSILQQLKQKLQDGGVGGTELSWRRRPDGELFHREEEERAPPSGCNQKVNL